MPPARAGRRGLLLGALALVGALATWLVTLDLGPWRALVALLDPDQGGGGPLGPHYRVTVRLPPGTGDDHARELAAQLDERLAGVASVVAHDASALVLATSDASAEARATVEQALTRGRARFEALRMLDRSPVIDAVRARVRDAPPFLPSPSRDDVVLEADDEATITRTLADLTASCAPCRPGPEEAFVVERQDVYDGGDAPRARWLAYLVSRAEPALDDRSIAGATLSFDDLGHPVVMLELTPDGERRIEELSRAWLDRRVAMLIDGVVHSAPVIAGVITGGPIQLALGGRSYEDDLVMGRDLVTRLRPGVSLPQGATLAWEERAGVDPTAFVAALILTVLIGALGALLVALGLMRALRVEPAPAALGPRAPWSVSGDLVARALVTVLLALAPWALGHVPLPFVDHELIAPTELPITTLGLIPVLLAHLVVSLVVALAPRLRALRSGDPHARRRLLPATALATLALAALQAWPMTLWLQPFDPSVQGLVPGLVIMALAAGAFALWGAAALVSRFGIGNGFAVLTAASVIEELVVWEDGPRPLLLGVALAIATAVLAATSCRARADAETTRRLPLAGLVPLDLVTTALQLVALVTSLAGLAPPPWSEMGPAALVIGVAVLGFGLSWLLGRPLPPRLLASVSLAGVALLVAIALVASALGPALPGVDLAGLALLVALPALLADIGSELAARARHGALVALTSAHDVDAADAVGLAMARAEVPVALRAARARSLTRFMGPWLPVEVLVPRDHLEAARAALAAHAHADLLRPFEDDPSGGGG